MVSDALQPEDIVLTALPAHQPRGREQEGRRPAIAVGLPAGELRYPVIVIAPVTTRFGNWVQQNTVLYPTLSAGAGGLSQDSVVLLDQIRAIDVQRIVSYIGSLSREEYAPILAGLKHLFRI